MEVGTRFVTDPRPEYVPWRRESSKDCSWDAHIAKVIGEGKVHVGKMDAILTDSHLDTRVNRCIMMNVILYQS